MPAFLLEIGLEEIPAGMIENAQQELATRCRDLLARERLASETLAITSYSTPRRLAVLAEGLLAGQEDVTEQVVGPSVAVAFKNGVPSPAAIAFAKKNGVEVDALERIQNAKGEYVAATVRRQGRSAAEVLAGALPAEMAGVYWPKNIYWRAGKPERFVRPVRWLVALLDEEVLPLEFAGVWAGNESRGHRVLHGSQPVVVRKPQEYADKLRSAFVEVDAAARKQRIRKALDAAARQIPGARWREDEPLVNTATNLTEWPSVILGEFEAEYLALPEEVLVTVMRDHQKYFALEDANGKLLPNFLAVLNTQADAAGEAIIRHGNERVLRARFNDARFFWDVDQKIPLVDRVEMLKAVTFQKDLGSYWQKTEANQKIAAELAKRVADAGTKLDAQALQTAATLAKADLTTELVKEFTELQGIVGGLYARHQQLGEEVAQAIYWQYRPASAEDAIPPTVVGQILGLADRMNTIVDMFAIGLEPTGSKDPFGLRRAGNAIVKILAESKLSLTLTALHAAAKKNSAQKNVEGSSDAVGQFLIDRLGFYLRETCGFRYDTVNAVLASGHDAVSDAVARAQAVEQVRLLPDFVAISAAFKRMKNILKQANAGQVSLIGVNETLLRDAAERQLWEKAQPLQAKVESLRKEYRYEEAMREIATLRSDVDAFFDTVMVMAEEQELKENRLRLLQSILRSFTTVADFSEIAS
jgi:glycyl-tRNA synthetase beta chain